MCGIAGFVGAGGLSDLKAMTAALAHRGPDGEGHFADPRLRLYIGARRLAVIDVAGGGQPLWSSDGRVGVVHNGEVYNHTALRTELERLGHRFTTDHSDTEVLVHGWRQWGAALPERLNGMFAFAVVDLDRRLLFLARDRFGEKPLYWFRRDDDFAFASELTALARHPSCSRRLDVLALQKYFAWGYVPAPRTPYADVQKLEPGCHLVLDVVSGDLRIEQYWEFRLQPDDALESASEDALAEQLRSLLSEAVRRRLAADVPLGFLLSGGIDSSAALALAAKHVPAERLNAFTVGFDDPSFDETSWAREAAQSVGARHDVETLGLDAARALAPDVLSRVDEPLADPSLLATYVLCRFARQSVTVALSGDGGDELFAGYDPFRALAPSALYRRCVPAPLRTWLCRMADALPIGDANMSLDFRVRRALSGARFPPAMWNPVWLAPADPALLAEIFTRPVSAEELYAEAIEAWESTDSRHGHVERTLEFYTNFYLPNNILPKVDRASMMVSLESRAVFLDNDLVAFCARLPTRFKYRGGRGKYLLRKALVSIVPDQILQRPKKGFGIPVSAWLRSWPLPPSGLLDEMVDRRVIERSWREHRHRERDHRLLLWSWLSAEASLGATR